MIKMDNTFNIRPHHGMCMAYFVGYGYSDGFSANMEKLLNSLLPNTEIRLTVSTDVVCVACPNNKDGLCDKPKLVESYDKEVLRLCGFIDGQIISFGEFTESVYENILAKNLRHTICGSCQWSEICTGEPKRLWTEPKNKRLNSIYYKKL